MSAAEIDCVTAVMLKILDGKCRMPEREKHIMQSLYDACKTLQGQHLGKCYHAMISEARFKKDKALLDKIYETRVLAETRISRPVMKAFKTRLRTERILPSN